MDVKQLTKDRKYIEYNIEFNKIYYILIFKYDVYSRTKVTRF